MAMMKGQVYADFERGLDESLEQANRLMAESFAGPDFGEGVRSFVEKRAPAFEPVSSAALAR
jgi:enoyl-CoA hydratase/carnithine racemase